jgi:hypothetical protein
MQPIHDFEIVSRFDESRFPNAEWDLKSVRDARFKDKNDKKWKGHEEHILYRGRMVKKIYIYNEFIITQLKTNKGFLIISSCEYDFPSLYGEAEGASIYVLYLDGNFQNVDLIGLATASREEYDLARKSRYRGHRGPVDAVRIVGGRQLEFHVLTLGWYRVTLHEDEPQRFLFHKTNLFESSPPWWKKRHFTISLLPPRPNDPPVLGPWGRRSRLADRSFE